jgi:hypothetical protein
MQISWEALHEAISIYLRLAYPHGTIPEIVRQRIALNESRPVAEIVQSPPFESYTSEAPTRCTVHALRLGSEDYPHIKLEIRPFPGTAGFVFWVNTHDQFISPDSNLPGADAWRGVVRRNRDLKQDVERAWAAKKLPTFTTAIEEELRAT